MINVNSVISQLSNVRRTLDESQLSQSNSAQGALNKKAISQLLYRLSFLCQGVEKQLDTQLTKLRDRLSNAEDLSQLTGDFVALEMLLKQHQNSAEENLVNQRELANQGAENLKQVNGLPPKIRSELQSVLSQPPLYSLKENQQRLQIILSLYHHALTNKPGGFPVTQHLPIATETKSKESLLDKRLHTRICDDLQRLITELDYTDKVGEQLKAIRANLLIGVNYNELPQICLNIIQLIIDGSRQERRQSQEFLISLNDELSHVHDHFSTTLSDSRTLQGERATNSGHLRSHLLELGAEISNAESLRTLKLTIHERLSTIGDVFKEKERLETKSDELVERLAIMEAQVQKLKGESADHKKHLESQKNKLFIDSLTQIYNRNAFDERLNLEFKRWQRYGYNLGIAIIDIDHFKTINDQFGHLAGDKALRVVAQTLQKSIRENDFLARFGGEEFVILMPNISPDALLSPLETVRTEIGKLPFRFKNQQVNISVSIGATLFKESDEPLDAFERADQALYEAKSSGRNKTNIIS